MPQNDGNRKLSGLWLGSAALLVLLLAIPAQAESPGGLTLPAHFTLPALAFQPAPPPAEPPPPPPGERRLPPPPPPGEERVIEDYVMADELGYRGVNDFFNVREAYSDVAACEWEFSVGALWATFQGWSPGRTDHVELRQTVKYGITDNLHVALTASEPLGYGGEGAGELFFTIFNTFWRERDWIPAFAGYASMRIPSGYQSNRMDGTLGGVFTKAIGDRFRLHFEGWAKYTCGLQGHLDDFYADHGWERRDFQWAAGPGFDVLVGDTSLIVVNFLNGSSPMNGEKNYNIIEAGFVHQFCETDRTRQQIKVAADYDICDRPYTAHLGAKIQWELYVR